MTIISLEGPSAVGKSTLASALVGKAGAALTPELDAGPAPRRTHRRRGTWSAYRAVAPRAIGAVERLPASQPGSLHLLDHMADWLRRNSPAAPSTADQP